MGCPRKAGLDTEKMKRLLKACLHLNNHTYQKVHGQKYTDHRIGSFRLNIKGLLTFLEVFTRDCFVMVLVSCGRLFRFVKLINVDWERLEFRETYVSDLSQVIFAMREVASIAH